MQTYFFHHVTCNTNPAVPLSLTFSGNSSAVKSFLPAFCVGLFFNKSATSCQSNTPPIWCHTLPHCSARNCLKVYHAVLGLQASHTTFSWWISAKWAVTSRDFASKKYMCSVYICAELYIYLYMWGVGICCVRTKCEFSNVYLDVHYCAGIRRVQLLLQ